MNKIIDGVSGAIIAFGAKFVQHCEGEKPALTGEIKFNAGAVGDAVNQPPGVYAGEDQRFFAPNGAKLSGIAGDDGLPNGSLTTTWSVVDGPGTVTFANPEALQTTAILARLVVTRFDSPRTIANSPLAMMSSLRFSIQMLRHH